MMNMCDRMLSRSLLVSVSPFYMDFLCRAANDAAHISTACVVPQVWSAPNGKKSILVCFALPGDSWLSIQFHSSLPQQTAASVLLDTS